MTVCGVFQGMEILILSMVWGFREIISTSGHQ